MKERGEEMKGPDEEIGRKQYIYNLDKLVPPPRYGTLRHRHASKHLRTRVVAQD